MANGNPEPEEKQTIQEKQPIQEKKTKKPYTKPAFRFERVFETQALTCGKVEATQFLCRHNRKNS